jgi:dienelactone hydrolase
MKKRRTFRTDRPDGRFLTTPSFVHHRLKALKPRLAFDPSFTQEEFLTWKRQVRRKLRELMAFPNVPPQPAPRLLSEHKRKGYVLQRWELYPEPDSVVPFLMLVPEEASETDPAPAVLCLPGTDHPKESLAGESRERRWRSEYGIRCQMARHFVSAGFVALAFDNPGTAGLADPVCQDWRRQSLELLWLGRSYESLSVFQKLPALRLLENLPFVDRRRIAACGFSLGAKPALLLGVLEEGVKAVVWNDMACNWRTREVVTNLKPVAPWHYIPGFTAWFDYIDLMAALAPTPLLITEGGRSEDHRLIRRAFDLMKARGNFKVTFMPSFADPSKRKMNRLKMPVGLTPAEYMRYCCVGDEHYFKGEVAVPWLQRILAGTEPAAH